MKDKPIRFLSLANVLYIHADTIREEGGNSEIRELGLLESALAMPQATFGGEYLHKGLAGKASAYLFHICQNHAFVDGNKRTVAFSTVLFLALNGVSVEKLLTSEELEKLTLDVANGTMTKQDVQARFTHLEIE